MNGKHFNEQDKQKVIDFVNMVAQHAEFKMNTEQIIEYFKLLSYMQAHIIPKINDHILEVKSVSEPEPEEKPKRGRPKKEGK